MTTDEKEQLGFVCKKYNIYSLHLVGSFARGDQENTSDIDLLVNFGRSEDPMEQYFGAKEAIEEVFRKPVDLIEADAIKNRIFKQYIDYEKVLLYEA
ncbi:MAG: nucleotidyltransferase family protein [Spirochaetia bacterium]